jgi:replicative superfamily II helicase
VGFFDGLQGKPARQPAPVPMKPPVDQELVDMIGAEKVKEPKKTPAGRLSPAQWKAAELHWRECRSFTEVAERANVSASAVSKRASKNRWIENLGRECATDIRQSQAAIVARVNEQVARLQPEDREALVSALRADHVKLAAELKATAMEAIGRLGIDRVVDAIRLLDLGVSIEQGLVGDKGNDHRSLTVVLQQQMEKFAVKPKIKVTEGEA